ncbi:hypothetical protein ASPCAL06730 [Aspergillus calidoustus]|uniref:Uncharacterized protein n=1 Tax=Aspergillus calidoustus TaxID=454130 RepID=A0A0U5C9D9_ASPCI|nr:hypothetical protein ASPCAL06730 [Aspergillus calidoustus]
MTFPFKRSPSSPRIPESTLSHEKDRFLANALGVTVIPAILIGNGTAVDGSIELVSSRDDPPAGPFWLAPRLHGIDHGSVGDGSRKRSRESSGGLTTTKTQGATTKTIKRRRAYAPDGSRRVWWSENMPPLQESPAVTRGPETELPRCCPAVRLR